MQAGQRRLDGGSARTNKVKKVCVLLQQVHLQLACLTPHLRAQTRVSLRKARRHRSVGRRCGFAKILAMKIKVETADGGVSRPRGGDQRAERHVRGLSGTRALVAVRAGSAASWLQKLKQ